MFSLQSLRVSLSVGYNVQLHTKGSTEDGEQHGCVAAEDRTASDGQYSYGIVVAFAQREAYLYTLPSIWTERLA
jgi:hypothetical protein